MSESESELESDDDEQGMTVVPTSKAKRGAGAGVGGGAGGGRSDTCNEAAILLKLEQLSTVKVPLRQGPSSSPDGSGRRCTPEGGEADAQALPREPSEPPPQPPISHCL